ncbi:MAG: endopeptidase La [Actinomycetes bacterium]|jgi:ATP-dependent Lon protease|nr:MAG: endopeptidase La [Actinomycetota bacterium]
MSTETTNTGHLTLPVLPLHNGVVFPHMVVTINVETAEGKTAVEAAERSGGRILLVPRINGRYATVGTIGDIQQVDEDGNIVVAGLTRARVGAGSVDESGALWVAVDEYPEVDIIDEELEKMVAEYKATVSAVLENRGLAGVAERLLDMESPSRLADLAVYSPDLSMEQKVQLLEALDIRQRFGLLNQWMTEVLADMELRRRVREEATERIEKSQREYILRQQLDAIRKELGEEEDVAGTYRKKLEETPFPEAAAEAVKREIDRLERTSEQSPEHSWIRTWLDTMFDVPWGELSDDRIDLDEAWAVLEADHTGLTDVKERIIEHLAVRKLRAERGIDADTDRRAGSILLLVGPPGVGKTSLGESVARALGREFVRVALGGIRDEAEIRGHRRTYVGARPGRIVRALIEAGTMNPVFLLDEMDKVGSDWRGDPSSALLEVLDPAQNHTFRDHYLEVDLDLSNVMFIATANMLETIPAPLLDRTEVIRIDGYTDDEKVAIARDHLLPRQVRAAGLQPEELKVTDEALSAIVERYTNEAGVRNLERELGKLARKVSTRIARGEGGGVVEVGPDDLTEYLGKPKVWKDQASDRTNVPGVATGLAVTGAGGDILFIEATRMEGEPGLTLTGQLGDVMKESAQIALSYVKAHAGELGIDPKELEGRIHLHVPAGAIPKDGPSAGIAMLTALVSLLTGKKVKGTVGMTGEITLQGKVLPIGGVKQKVLAAHRAGLTEVILPKRNEIDLDDIPEKVREEIEFHIVETADQVLAAAF